MSNWNLCFCCCYHGRWNQTGPHLLWDQHQHPIATQGTRHLAQGTRHKAQGTWPKTHIFNHWHFLNQTSSRSSYQFDQEDIYSISLCWTTLAWKYFDSGWYQLQHLTLDDWPKDRRLNWFGSKIKIGKKLLRRVDRGPASYQRRQWEDRRRKESERLFNENWTQQHFLVCQIPDLWWQSFEEELNWNSVENPPFSQLAWLLARTNSTTIYISVFAVPKLKIPKYQSWKAVSLHDFRAGGQGVPCQVISCGQDWWCHPSYTARVCNTISTTVIAVPQDHYHFKENHYSTHNRISSAG